MVPGTYTLSTLDGAGIIRRYDVVIPVGYNDTVGHSVIYAFHPAGGRVRHVSSIEVGGL